MFRLNQFAIQFIIFISPNDKYCYMKKEIPQNVTPSETQNVNTEVTSGNDSQMDRRKFVGLAASTALAFSIVPRHVLGGKNFVAPSDKITLAYIGVGTQGVRELLPLLAMTEFQVIAFVTLTKKRLAIRTGRRMA